MRDRVRMPGRNFKKSHVPSFCILCSPGRDTLRIMRTNALGRSPSSPAPCRSGSEKGRESAFCPANVVFNTNPMVRLPGLFFRLPEDLRQQRPHGLRSSGIFGLKIFGGFFEDVGAVPAGKTTMVRRLRARDSASQTRDRRRGARGISLSPDSRHWAQC